MKHIDNITKITFTSYSIIEPNGDTIEDNFNIEIQQIYATVIPPSELWGSADSFSITVNNIFTGEIYFQAVEFGFHPIHINDQNECFLEVGFNGMDVKISKFAKYWDPYSLNAHTLHISFIYNDGIITGVKEVNIQEEGENGNCIKFRDLHFYKEEETSPNCVADDREFFLLNERNN